MRRNVEWKALLRDTNFHAVTGRLKLREQEPGTAELVQYDRIDRAAARTSAYRVVSVYDPDALRDALEASLGVGDEDLLAVSYADLLLR